MQLPTLFPRDPNRPLISILMPTRGRVKYLRESLDTCISLAANQANLEVIFKFDNDDTESLEFWDWFSDIGIPCQAVISNRGNGYHDMHIWVNQMASLAKGEWLFLFNDDAKMTAQDWDLSIQNIVFSNVWIGYQDVCLLLLPTIGRPFAQEFFCLRRKTYEILERISLSPHNDNWIYSIMKFVGADLTLAGLGIEHNSHKMEDKIREESVEAYKSTILSITSIEARLKRYDDAGVLLDHMHRLEEIAVWEYKPITTGWYMLRYDDKFPIKVVAVLTDGTLIGPGKDGKAEVNHINDYPNGKWLLLNQGEIKP